MDTEGKRDSRLETYCEIRRIRAQESVKRLPTASLTDSWDYRELMVRAHGRIGPQMNTEWKRDSR